MSTSVKPEQSSRKLANGGSWIEGRLERPKDGMSGPLVFGSDWLLEMIRCENGRSLGLFWAPFAIVAEIPNLDALWNGRFIGYSFPGEPPAVWLTTSMMFDMGTAPLAAAPEELIAMLQEPRSYVSLERTDKASGLSLKAKRIIAANYRSSLSIRVVARELGVSHAHLARQFKRDFGLTPINYLHRLRVTEAIGRLSQGEGPVEVGYDVGFNDTSRFYRDFLKVTGTSPGKCGKSFGSTAG